MGRRNLTGNDSLQVCVSFEPSRISRGCLERAYELLVPIKGYLKKEPMDPGDESRSDTCRKGWLNAYDPGSHLCARF